MTEQESTPPQSAAEESLKAEIPVPENPVEGASVEAEEEIDLNHLFPGEENRSQRIVSGPGDAGSFEEGSEE